MGVFSTQFVPLISIWATKILEEQNCQLLPLQFLQTAEDRKKLEVVDIKKILVPN